MQLNRRFNEPKSWNPGLFLTGLVLILLFGPGAGPATAETIRVGVGVGVEEQALAQLSKLVLEEAGLKVQLTPELYPETLRTKLLAGELDLGWGYTGRALVFHHRNPDRGVLIDPERCFRVVAAQDKAEGLIWTGPAPGNNTYGLLMLRKKAREWRVKTVADLVAVAKKMGPKIKLGLEKEYQTRPDGHAALAGRFGFKWSDFLLDPLSLDQIFGALREGRVQVAVGPVIDGRIDRLEIVALQSDKPFFPAYNPAPIWRTEVFNRFPEAVRAIDRLTAKLDNKALNRIHFLMEIRRYKPTDAARTWLDEVGG